MPTSTRRVRVRTLRSVRMAVAWPPIATSRSLERAAQGDDHGQRQAQRHEQGELRIVGDGQDQGRHGQRDEDGVPADVVAQEQAQHEGQQHHGADADDLGQAAGQPVLGSGPRRERRAAASKAEDEEHGDAAAKAVALSL